MGVKVNKSSNTKTNTTVSSEDWNSLFEPAPTELTRRCVMMNIYGDTGTGRTTFALTAPSPIVLFHSAEKIDGIVQQFSSQKEIHLYDFGVVFRDANKSLVQAQAREEFDRFTHAYYTAFSRARTIIIDTETDLWELLRQAHFGDVKPSGGRLELNWGPVNAEWNTLFRHFRHQNTTNLMVISKTEDEYKENKSGFGTKTGKTIRKGQKNIPFMADIYARTSRDPFTLTLEDKAWFNADAIGLEFVDDAISFPEIMMLITGIDASEWE